MRRLLLCVFVLSASPAFAQLQAPNEKALVAAVRAAHPEIDTCDEAARGAIVDWSAQRLNARDARVRWGRKGSTPSGNVKNSDALTYQRPDGLFEIYDVIGGGKPCNASWQAPTRALKPGENGYWVPPQLGPEPGVVSPEPMPNPPAPPAPPAASDIDQRVAALEQRIATLEAMHANVPPPAPPPAADGLAGDVKRIRELLEAVAKRFGLQ